jgi:hypothetical protein
MHVDRNIAGRFPKPNNANDTGDSPDMDGSLNVLADKDARQHASSEIVPQGVLNAPAASDFATLVKAVPPADILYNDPQESKKHAEKLRYKLDWLRELPRLGYSKYWAWAI